MRPIIDDLLFLYEHRMGKEKAQILRQILSSEQDEPYEFILEYERHPIRKTLIIKSFLLRKTDDEKEDIDFGIESNLA